MRRNVTPTNENSCSKLTSSNTENSGRSDNRAASTQPALPPPMTGLGLVSVVDKEGGEKSRLRARSLLTSPLKYYLTPSLARSLSLSLSPFALLVLTNKIIALGDGQRTVSQRRRNASGTTAGHPAPQHEQHRHAAQHATVHLVAQQCRYKITHGPKRGVVPGQRFQISASLASDVVGVLGVLGR